MSTPISGLELDELMDMHEYLELIYKRRKKENPMTINGWLERGMQLVDIKMDMAKIQKAMFEKIPESHHYEIYKLEEEMKEKAERQRKIIEHIQRQNRKEIKKDLILTFFLSLAIIATLCVMLYIGDDINRSLKSLFQNLFK